MQMSMDHLPLIREDKKEEIDMIYSMHSMEEDDAKDQVAKSVPKSTFKRQGTKKLSMKHRPIVILLDPENCNKPTFGSLFDMFQSEMFTLPMLM